MTTVTHEISNPRGSGHVERVIGRESNAGLLLRPKHTEQRLARDREEE